MNIYDFQKNINSFDIEAEVVGTIETTGEEIAHLIRGQMSLGKSGNGKDITNRFTHKTDYSVYWGEYRMEKGLQVDHFDFRVTGEFTSKIEVISITPESFKVTSRSIKTDDLEDMFGEEIMNMTDESRSIFIQTSFFPELKYRIENKLGVKFG